jgi:hypothetical protein
MIHQPAQLPQTGKRKPRRSHHGQCGCVGLGHPRWQEQPDAIRQLDHKVRIAGVSETPNNREPFASMRVVRIPEDDLKRLLLGSMSCVRKGR